MVAGEGASCPRGRDVSSPASAVLLSAALAIGCDANLSFLTIGVEPLSAQGRTGLDSDLESDDSVGVGITYSTVVKAPGHGSTAMLLHVGLGHESPRAEGAGGKAHWTWFDGGMAIAEVRGGPGYALGFSLAYLDSVLAGRNAFGPGGFARGFYRLHGESRVGLEIYGEVHGWVVFDNEGASLAGRAAAGLCLVAIF